MLASAQKTSVVRLFQPFLYQGSKRKLAPDIVALIPEGARRLVEPFAGSAAVSLRALAEGRVGQAWLNDANAPLMALWEVAINRPDELAECYTQLWHAQLGDRRAFYDRVRDRFSEAHRGEVIRPHASISAGAGARGTGCRALLAGNAVGSSGAYLRIPVSLPGARRAPARCPGVFRSGYFTATFDVLAQ